MMTTDMTFETVTAADLLAMSDAVRDTLPFGVVGMDHDGIAQIYNATEARLAGLDPRTVLGRHFFESVAQCMNNYMVAQRFADEPELDAIIPFVLTLRMRPTPVRLHLLAGTGTSCHFVLIQR